MIIKLAPAFLPALLLAACTPPAPAPETPVSAPDLAEIAPIRSGEMVIKFQIGDAAPRDWTITPELSPDTLVFECPANETVPVTFTTDLETRTLPMTLAQDSIQFDILMQDGTVALTELKCIDEIARYQGDFSAERASAGEFATDLAPLLNTYFKPGEPGIILSIAEGDTAPYETALGLDQLTPALDRRADQAFDIASVSKEFTAVSILQLAERDRLSLQDPVAKYFDDVPNGDTVTLHHLLTHTHGLAQIRTADAYDETAPRTLATSLEHIRSQGAEFAPGEQYSYGNTSYYLLAHIAEQVSGEDRETYIRQNLLEPAGMTQSYFITNAPDEARRAGAFTETDNGQTPRSFDFHPSFAFGAGDIVSTLGDLRKWQRAISNGTLISADTFAEMVTPRTLNDGTEIARGYGPFHGKLGDELIVYNTGDYFTHTRHFYMPSRDLSIILNTNGTPQYDGGQSSIVWAQIIGKVFNRQFISLFGDDIDLNDV